MLAQLGCADLAERSFGTLSQGEQQKVLTRLGQHGPAQAADPGRAVRRTRSGRENLSWKRSSYWPARPPRQACCW